MPNRNLILDVFCILAVAAAMPPPASAYLDASTLAMVSQAVAAGAMAALLFGRRLIAKLLKSVGVKKD